MGVMIPSGWAIHNAYRTLPFLLPSWTTLGGSRIGGLRWKVAAMWVVMMNGLFYLVHGLAIATAEPPPDRSGSVGSPVRQSTRSMPPSRLKPSSSVALGSHVTENAVPVNAGNRTEMVQFHRERGRLWVPTPFVRASILFHIGAAVALVARPFAWRWWIGGLLTNHLLLGGFGMWPRSSVLGANITRVSANCRGGRCIVLTFDDGPDPEVTRQVLELLDRYDAKASFFCIGERAARFPDIVAEIVRHGHSVENHSNCHPIGFACYSVGGLRREIGRAQLTLTRLAGTPPAFFRAPFGLRSPLLAPALATFPLCYVSWTRRGYDAATRRPEAVLRRITRGLAAGDILVLHDTARSRTTAGRPVVLDVLPALLQQIEAVGLRVLSLPLAMAELSVRGERS